MGTLFAGFLRAPMTSVFMVLELSGNYSIILPVMISNTIAYLVTLKYQRPALFDLLSQQDGIDLPSMEEQREESTLLVEDAMQKDFAPVLRGDESIEEALRRIAPLPEGHFLVSLGARGWGSVTKELLQWQADQGRGGLRLADLPYDTRFPWVHPDQPLYVAMRTLGDRPLLPVVNRADFGRLEGVISLEDILRAYRAVAAAGTSDALSRSEAQAKSPTTPQPLQR